MKNVLNSWPPAAVMKIWQADAAWSRDSNFWVHRLSTA